MFYKEAFQCFLNSKFNFCAFLKQFVHEWKRSKRINEAILLFRVVSCYDGNINVTSKVTKMLFILIIVLLKVNIFFFVFICSVTCSLCYFICFAYFLLFTRIRNKVLT